MEFFDKRKYDSAGIKLYFQKVELTPYIQRIGYFEPGLSIIDVLMFNSPEEINKIAIEHIIPTDIGIDKIECLGTSNYSSKRSLADILMGFFKGHNEENIIKNNMDLLI